MNWNDTETWSSIRISFFRLPFKTCKILDGKICLNTFYPGVQTLIRSIYLLINVILIDRQFLRQVGGASQGVG